MGYGAHNKTASKLFEEALLLFVEDAKLKKDFDTNRRHAIYWRSVFGSWKLSDITGEDIMTNLPTYSATHKKPLSPSTKNRYRTSIFCGCFHWLIKMVGLIGKSLM